MKRLFNILILVLSAAFLCSACGGGGGGGGGSQLQPPAANLTGTWAWTGTVQTSSCPDTPAGSTDTPWAGIVDHPAGSNNFTITSVTSGFTLVSAQGTISGSSITLQASYPEGGGTSSFKFSGSLDSYHTTINGTSTWTWKETGSSYQCNGTTHVTALRTSGGEDSTPPTVPTNLSATAVSSTQINLSWTASTDNVGVAGYNIFLGTGTYIGSVTGTLSNVTGLSPSTYYCFKVSAYDASNNESGQCAQQCATTFADGGDSTPPTIPTNLIATAVSSTQINLSWTASTDNVGVAGYKIYSGTGTYIGYVTGTLANVTGLSPSTNYCFKVSAYDAVGNESAQSAQQCATTSSGGGGEDITPPSVPTNLIATAVSSTQINLSWTASTDNVGVVGYKIYSGTGTYIKSVTSTSTTMTGLSPSTPYCYKISAYDAVPLESAQCAQQCATTLAPVSPPAVPTSVSATNITQTSALLTWTDNSSNEIGFEIGTCSGLVSVGGNGALSCMAGFTKVGQVGVNVTSYSLTGLTPSTSYQYFVRAYNSAGSSSNLGIGFTTATPTSTTGTLRLHNSSTVSIDYLYLSPTSQSLWGSNQLLSSLGAGYYTDIVNVPPNSYDAKATAIGTYSTYYAYLYNFSITAGNTYHLYAYNSSFSGSLKIFNNSIYTITDIYVSPSGSSSWGLKQNLFNIGYGGWLHLTDLVPGSYDVKVVWLSGAIQYVWSQSVTSLNRTDVSFY